MKAYSLLTASLLLSCASFATVQSQRSTFTEWAIAERGPHHKVYQREELIDSGGGQVHRVAQRYVELASGMHYREGGEWREAKAEFTLLPSGYAVASEGQHSVVISPILNDIQGAVDFETPEGKRLRSTILGLSLRDTASGESLLVAEIVETVGTRVSPNEILFEDCFDDVHADVKFTVNRNGFHQDVILREKLNPRWLADHGFDAETTRLEIWTEFMESPEPTITSRQLVHQDILDEELDFGVMKIPAGRAYGNEAAGGRGRSITVPKQWLEIDGRRFLMESVDLAQLESMLSSLPDWERDEKGGRQMYAERRPPTPLLRRPGINSIVTADLGRPAETPSGVVLDYEIVIGSLTNLVLKGDTTYYVNGAVTVFGDLTIEGGTVVKYNPTNASYIDVYADNVYCETAPYRPATFTSLHDDTIGATIAGSTGVASIHPQSAYLTFFYGDLELHNLRLRYAYDALSTFAGSLVLRDSQFVLNDRPLSFVGTDPCAVQNVLVDHAVSDVIYTEGTAIQGEHLTVHNASRLWAAEGSSSLALTNSLLVDVESLGSGLTAANKVIQLASGVNVFKPSGAGHFYLPANSPYRAAGVATGYDLSRKTTHPPVVITNSVASDYTLSKQAARASGTPDIGYHYDPVDYIAQGFGISSATLTIQPGVVVAGYNRTAIRLDSHSAVNAIGTPTAPIWFTRLHLVQEQPVDVGYGPGSGLPFDPYNTDAAARPGATFDFARFSTAAGGGYTMYHGGSRSFATLTLANCELYNGNSIFAGDASSSASLWNTLFHRGTVDALLTGSSATLHVSNCLFHKQSSCVLHDEGAGRLEVLNSVFENCRSDPQGTAQNGFNAYLGCRETLLPSSGTDITLTEGFAWESGPLGDFYQPSDSALIDAGSTRAGLAGLSDYTTQTDQLSEADSPVDIGLHYVALNAGGEPIDADADTIPDYVVASQSSPTIICPPTVNLTADQGQTYASGVDLGTPTVEGNGTMVSVVNDAPLLFPVGTNTVTWTATDPHRNSSSCQQLVVVSPDPKVRPEPPQALVNAGFESGDVPPGHTLTGWTSFGENGPNVYCETMMPRSGSSHLKLFGSFMSSTNYTGVYQDVPAEPGQTWRASAYVATASDDGVRSGCRARVELEFYDAGHNLLAPAARSKDFGAEDLTQRYRLLSASATAPAGTASARIICVNEQRWHTEGAVYFDDAGLSPLSVSVASDGQATVPNLKSLSDVSVISRTALRQTPDAGTRVGTGVVNVELANPDSTNPEDAAVLPLTVVDDTLPTVTGPSPVLANPSFEFGEGTHGLVMDNWTGTGRQDPSLANVLQEPYVPRTGTFVAKLFQNFTTNPNYTDLYQQLPAGPGETWQASVYVWLPADDPIEGGNEARVRLEFYDAAGVLLAHVNSPGLSQYDPKNVWTLLSAWGEAPAETAYARIVCQFVGDGVSTGAAFFDDASLSRFVLKTDSCQLATLPDLTSRSSAQDNCTEVLVVLQEPTAGTALPAGITPVTLSATDAAGNVGHCRVDILVVDTNAQAMAFTVPDAVCQRSVDNTASVAGVQGGSYTWTVENGRILSGQGTPAIVWEAGELGWAIVSVNVDFAGGCSFADSKAVALECPWGSVDSDGDGLTDYEEINIYHTDPHAASTDGSGISDYEQIHEIFVDPLATNFDGTITDAVVKSGADISGQLGSWQIDGDEIHALDRRGYVEYSVTTGLADVYRLVVEGREQLPSDLGASEFDLMISVDGEYLGRRTLTATDTTYGRIHLYSPYLQPGSHVVRVFWDNAASQTALRLRSLRLQVLGGPDANDNGIKDWVEERLLAMSGFDPTTPATSYVSPMCLEGRDRYLSMMTLQVLGAQGSALDIVPSPAPVNRWYADVPLSETGATEIVASFQNGGRVQTRQVAWVARNVLEGGAINVRSGDSLLLTAAPEGATNGGVQISVQQGGQLVGEYSADVDTPVAVPFPGSGTYQVSGTYAGPTGGSQTGTLTVQVIEHSLGAADPAVCVAKVREWSVPAADAFVVGDPRLLMITTDHQTNEARTVDLTIDQNELRHVVLRIRPGGPILDGASANGLKLFTARDTYNYIVEMYEDDSRLVETMVILSPVAPDVTVQIYVLVGGVTFDDGTTYKELTAADFDELGQKTIRFIMPEGVVTANCHRLKVVQGEENLIGTYH